MEAVGADLGRADGAADAVSCRASSRPPPANLDAGAAAIALFEIARVYLPDGELPNERVRVAGIAVGDFFHGKGVVEALYAALKAEPVFERAEDALFHPGKAARTPAGLVGELHPTAARRNVVRIRARPRRPVRRQPRAGDVSTT